MHESLGELIRRARMQLGVEQSDLARRLGVGQQTVSRWERGLSRPRPAVLAQLAQAVNLSESQLLSAAGHESVVGLADSPPTRTLLAKLPFHLLSAEQFESFSADLARHLFPGAEASRNGGPGSRQDGADVIVRKSSGSVAAAIQCKQVREFGPRRVRAVVSDMRIRADRCYLYLSRTASPEARKEIARHPGWQLRDASDLSADVRHLQDRDAAVRLVDTYFGGAYRELFLGLPDPGPWLTATDFFRPQAGGNIYTHDWTLVGRDAELGHLTAFLDDPEQVVGVVIGRGGIGKSRLLREFARTTEQRDTATKVRFLATNAVTGPRDFEALPSGGALVAVIDDAHDRSGLGGVIRGIRRARPEAKIILSLRPAGRGQLRADLREIGLHQSDIAEWQLGDLEFTAAEALATEALGPGPRAALPGQLAALAPDCPLLIVVGGALIGRGRLDPARLASGAGFRDEIMTAFRDTISTADTGAGSDVRQEVLRAIAALQPFRIDQPEFRSALSALTGWPFDQVMPQARHLEEAGVLIRRGHSLRIAPDLLGDAILAEAAMDLPSGVPTDYLERVLASAEGDCLLHVFVNASRVDWQVRTGYLVSRSLVESLWPVITGRFRAGDAATRLRLLDALGRVAFFQPDATIELVRWAMANPATAPAEATDWGGQHGADDRHVLEALPGALENAAYDRRYLRQAADLLWNLATRDERRPSQHPGHAIRVLQGLVEYNAAKSVGFHDLIVDAAIGWLRQEPAEGWLYSPFEVLKPLLATTVTAFIHEAMTVHIRTYQVTAAAVRGLRDRVLDLAFDEAQAQDARRAVTAVQAIGESIRYGNPDDPAEQAQWTGLFTETIERIGDLFARQELDPAVTVAARQALWWHYQYSKTATRRAAQDAWDQLPQSASHRLALALHDGWGHLTPRGSDANESELARETALREAVTEAIRKWPDDEDLVDQVEERLTVDRRAFPQGVGSPQPFIWTLATTRSSAAQVICRRVAQNPGSVLLEILPTALSRLAESHPDEAIKRALDLIATSELVVMRYVTEAFGFARGNRAGLLDGEADLLRSLVASQDPGVRQLAVTAALALARTSPALALELLTSVRFTDSASVADGVAAAFGPHGILPWASLPATQAARILDQLRGCPSIGSYEITTLLVEVSKSQPDQVISLLKDRVQAWQERKSPDYLPLPRLWHIQPDFKTHDAYPELLRSVRDWIAEDTSSAARRSMGGEIFAVVAGGYDEQARAIVLESLASDSAAEATAATAILREAPPGLAWDLDFTSQVLRSAELHGADRAEAVGRSLLASAINGSLPADLGKAASQERAKDDRLDTILRQINSGSIEERFYQALAQWNHSLIRLDDDASDRRPDNHEW